MAPLDRIVERDDAAGRDPEADRGIGPLRAGDAMVVDAAAGGEGAAAAVAGEGLARGQQLVQRGLVGAAVVVLPGHHPVVVEAERGQRPQLAAGRARDLARRVQVFDPQPPFAAGAAREQPAAQRRHQRAEMQRAGRRRGETAAVGGAGRRGSHGP